MLEEIKKDIKGLPPLPKNIIEINEICDDATRSVKELASVIEKDPMLTVNLFKIANSPLYSFRSEVTNIATAISLFGKSTTRALILNISINNMLNMDLSPYSLTPDEFVKISSLQSNLVKNWYRKIDKSKMEVLFLSALLQEIGKILISNIIVRDYNVEQFQEIIKTSADIAETEKYVLSVTTAEITTEIFKYWGFDDKLVKIIKYSDSYYDAERGIKDYSLALKVVKTAIPVNAPLKAESVDSALALLKKENMSTSLFIDAINETKN